MIDLLKEYRRDLHKIPEHSLKEKKTSDYLRQTLVNMGYETISVIETGLLVFIDAGSDESFAFRSDMDALEIMEKNDVDYISQHKGYMHACGHDGHMATLLGFAYYLKDKIHNLKKNILLIFQPAEETIGGANLICETGVLDKYNVKGIFGLHLFPDLEEGVIGCKSDELMAIASEVSVEVIGKSSHGAIPQNGVDSNVIAAKFLLETQNIVSRQVSPLEQVVITFGKIEGGDVRNILAGKCRLEGTIRAFDQSTFDLIKNQLYKISRSYEVMFSCKINISISNGYPAVINDSKMYQLFKSAVSEMNYCEFKKPFMIAEDFSFYQRMVPGVFFFLGTRNEKLGYTNSLHNERFNFNEQVLEIGVNAYISICTKLGVL